MPPCEAAGFEPGFDPGVQKTVMARRSSSSRWRATGLGAEAALPVVVEKGKPLEFWSWQPRSKLERGIWNRVRTVVPLRRIQHLDVSQDVLERNFDLGKLIVHTAGTRSSDVVLPGLRYEEAERLRDTVKHYITEDAV